MRITLNGLENPNNIITFTNCPTILTVSDTWTGTKSVQKINILNLVGVTNQDTYNITINGYVIKGTADLSKSVGNRFYITSSDTSANRVLVARKITDALNSLGGLTTTYRIYQETDARGRLLPTVIIESLEIGVVPPKITTNIPLTIINYSRVGASITSMFSGSINNKVHIVVYKNDTPVNRINSSSWVKGNYVTELEKTVYEGNVSFDLSQLFNTLSDFGELSEYELVVIAEVDDILTTLDDINHIYSTPGYFVNQGSSFIPNFTGAYLAQNVSRGSSSGRLNNSVLYLYYNSIVFSLYADNTATSMVCPIDYLNNAQQSIGQEQHTIFCGNNLNTFTLSLNQLLLQQSSYVDLTIPNVGTLRYTVIKPIHATDETQRIYWTNSYGGTSFFDFTGTRTEERKTDIETYERSLYDYYNSNRQELKKIYSKEVNITVTLTTHNIVKDGTWQLFDLQNSYNAWTTVNGKEYAIHITDIQVDETDVAGIYTAQIEYEYSMGDTF